MADTIHVLRDLISRVKCKPGWSFSVREDDDCPGALQMVIHTTCQDAYSPEGEKQMMRLNHLFTIPVTSFNEKSWRRWIFDRCLAVENHEMGEFFVVDGERPFAPMHGPGEDPYVVHEIRSETDALTTQDGSVRSR